MSCTPLAAYALRCGYGLARGRAGPDERRPPDQRSRASDPARTMRAERATANVRPTPLHGTSTRDPHRDQSRIVRSPGDVVCESPERAERLPLASRVSNVKLYTR